MRQFREKNQIFYKRNAKKYKIFGEKNIFEKNCKNFAVTHYTIHYFILTKNVDMILLVALRTFNQMLLS